MKMFRYLFLLFLLLPLQPLKAQQADRAKDTAKVKVPVAVDLLDANMELQKTKNLQVDMEQNLEKLYAEVNHDSLFEVFSKYIKSEAKNVNSLKSLAVSEFYLENELRSWKQYNKKINDAIASLRAVISEYQNNLKQLEYYEQVWKLTLESLRGKTDIPKELVSRIKKELDLIVKTKKKIEKKQKDLIVKENDYTDLLILIQDSIGHITELEKELHSSLFVLNEAPLWKTKRGEKRGGSIGQGISKVLEINKKSISFYLEHRDFLWIVFVLLVEIVLFLFVKKQYNRLQHGKDDPGYVNADFILNKKGGATIIVILLTTVLTLLPNIPLSLSALLINLLLLFSLAVIYRFAGSKGKQQTAVILLLFVLNEIELFMWYLGDYLRYFVVFEGVVGMLASFYLLGGKWRKTSEKKPFFVKVMVVFSYVSFLFYSVSFIANIIGAINLSLYLTRAAVKLPAVFLVIFLLYKTLEVLIDAGCKGGKTIRWQIQQYCGNIEKTFIRILKFASYYALFVLYLKTLLIYKPVYTWINAALVYDLVIGNFSITIQRIAGMIIIIVAFYFLANIFNVLFQNATSVNKKLSKGFVFAINKTVGYTIIIVGFLLGFAYAGIDLSKFSLLAGALGVGIGFGLQNIVNNFISGLILLYERPVNVGDVISVGNLKGEVTSIGVRASKVRSFDGAEVVVPNGNIISNDLINWTLSDKKRRLEIKIGVEYGADPNEVLKILQKIAVNNDDVLPDPAPMVLFDEFGDSSLNFRLLVWVYFNDSMQTRSNLSVAIYNALNEAGIEIPFPQMDVHLKESLTKKPEVVVPKAPDNKNVTLNHKKGAEEYEADSSGENDM